MSTPTNPVLRSIGSAINGRSHAASRIGRRLIETVRGDGEEVDEIREAFMTCLAFFGPAET